MMSISQTPALILLISSLLVAPAWANDTRLSMAVVPMYSSGDYGDPTSTTRMFNLPLLLKFKSGRFYAKFSVSLLAITTVDYASSGTAQGNNSTNATTDTTSGLGDSWLTAKYRTHDGTGIVPDTTPYIKIKIATAGTGLGSGYNDYEGGIELEWTLGERIFPFVDVAARRVADSSGTRSTMMIFDAGASFLVTDKTFISTYITQDQDVRVSGADPLDAIIAINYYYEPGNSLQAYLDKGLSTGSPDYAIGAGFEHRF